jgi:AraC family L-rhamnose operon regulatory protein RhaS
MKRRTVQPAIFTSPETIHHADTCDRLQQAAEHNELTLHALGRRGYPGESLPARVLPELPSIGYWDAPHDQAWGLGWHRNEGIELTFLARGKLDFAVDDQTFCLESGHLTITRPWQRHRVGNPHVRASRLHWMILDLEVRRPNEPWRWPGWLVFSAQDRQRLSTLLSHNEEPVWRANVAVRECFEQVAAQLERQDPAAAETRLKICLNALLAEVLQLLESKNIPLQESLSSTRRTVELFLSSLPKHLDRPWDLRSMASQCGLGRSRFEHYCRELSNLSPNRFLAHCRLQTAAKLLRHSPARTITEVAFACGFESSQYFANVFRREFGCAPSEYRQPQGPGQSQKLRGTRGASA